MHKSKIKGFLVLALALAMLFTTVGCSTDPKKLIWGIEEEEITYRYDKTIYLGVEKFRSLNPLISKDESVYFISKLVFDSSNSTSSSFRSLCWRAP